MVVTEPSGLGDWGDDSQKEQFLNWEKYTFFLVLLHSMVNIVSFYKNVKR